jgi:hypothetical protein
MLSAPNNCATSPIPLRALLGSVITAPSLNACGLTLGTDCKESLEMAMEGLEFHGERLITRFLADEHQQLADGIVD